MVTLAACQGGLVGACRVVVVLALPVADIPAELHGRVHLRDGNSQWTVLSV